MMNNFNLDNVTIVIPTYKRYPFLKRLLKFYQGFPTPVKILILDSTPIESIDTELDQLVYRKNITWKRFSTKMTYWTRIAKGLKFIKTDYVTLCPDDDFIIPKAINKCINFLNNNSNYSSAHGLYFFHTTADELRKSSFSIRPIYKGKLENKDLSSDRVLEYLSGQLAYYPLYAVHRLNTFKLIWSETDKYVSDWNLHELFSSCLSLIYGKMKVLPIFYASREPSYYNPNNYKIFKRTYSKNKVDKAILGVSKHLKIVEGGSNSKNKEFISSAFNIYLSQLEKEYLKNPNVTISLWTHLRNTIALRTKIRKIFFQGCHKSIYPKYFDDYKKVKYSVISSDLTDEELNISRIDFKKQGDVSEI